jgi:hypothetical protein
VQLYKSSMKLISELEGELGDRKQGGQGGHVGGVTGKGDVNHETKMGGIYQVFKQGKYC